MDNRENNRKQNRPANGRQGRQNGHQNWRNRNGDTDNNASKNRNKSPEAGPSGVNGKRNARTTRNFEATKPIGYKTLETVLQTTKNDSELISKLSSKMNGFPLRLDQQSIEVNFMCLILDALARVSRTSSERDTVQLLVHFYMGIVPKLSRESNFYRELVVFISDLSSHFVLYSQKYVIAIENLLTFLRRLQLVIYQKSYDAIRSLMQPITAQIEFINRKGNSLNENIVDTMNHLNESVENFEQMRDETEQNEVLMEPPQDFRHISIYPDTFDILSDHEPYIRKNIVDGKYVGGVDHYLDVQFRLLREDFVRPLRSGINEYRSIKSKADEIGQNAPKFRINDLNVYQNVRICGSKMLHSEQVHFCRFDCTPFRNLRWQYNKRLMNGSLVCLSPDDFETFFFATVAGQRDPEKLAKGEFQIRLEIESASMPEITPNIDFVMVESHVYFEAYRHNLKVLQEFGTENFPLEKYIVDVDKDISPPSYLTADSAYVISNGLPETDPDAKMSLVEVMSNREWPPRADFNLDESQYDAFRAALTKQMVVIQGPPGTGKTYIGLRIVEVLLANTSQWPILIVCYTNHALDQFLEGILKFCNDNELVRIGGKSQCPALEKYNLSTIKSGMKSRREVPTFIHHGRSESHHQLKLIQYQISELEKHIEHTSDTVLGDELVGVISSLKPEHSSQLRRSARPFAGLNEAILNWLGYRIRMDTDRGIINAFNGLNVDDTDDGWIIEEEPEMDEEFVRALEDERFIDESSSDDEGSDGPTTAPTIRKTYHGTSRPLNLNFVVPLDFVEDADGFQQVQKKRKTFKKQIDKEIKKSETMTEEQAKAVADIYALLPNNRWNLYRLWVKLYAHGFESRIKDFRDEYRTECLRYNGLRKQEDIEIVRKAKVIGMTTTGAAKYRHIIDGTKPKIAIVEEAAEVLEAHIVTALCKQTDHLILIGDHLQLRPNPSVYELAKKFHLEISLFERLIKNQMEYFQLKQQHRMRPCISSLLVPHIYKQLLDHPSVMEYEDVKGISKNMFFLNHSQNEKSVQETRSHLNDYEAEFIVELCRYIVLQGYETSQVTVLTTYSGQLHQIRKLMRNHHLLSGVRATVVDNYQGEECDIILLSFVRSNEEGNIGFLKDSHRVNVALSRARKGLYCIGNFDCLSEKSTLWQDLMKDLSAQQAIGTALEIFCQNHTDQKNLVSVKKDFDAAPEGGCSLACGFRLLCGHACESACHIVDKEHVDQYKKCHKPCDQIICEREHRCRKICHYGEECGLCKKIVDKIRPECEHTVKVACSGNPSLVQCLNPCKKYRSCGHKCKNICSAICEFSPCDERVQVDSPCGHKVTVKCSDSKTTSKLLDACAQPCRVELKCGHLCEGSCGRCKLGRLHISCNKKCTRILICGHPCIEMCSIDCPPCKKNCTNSCVHSKCPLRCGDPCKPCKEKCAWRCEHLECTKLCSEPCDRELCEHPNPKLLPKCKHPSIGVCGEKMPKLCRICDKDEVEDIFFGDEGEIDARFIELEDCKHIIEVNGLIRWMNTEPDSNSDSNGNNADRNSIEFKKCPKCKTIIRHTKSLNTFTQASLRDIQQVKLKTCGSAKENSRKQRDLFERVSGILDNESCANDSFYLRSIYKDIFEKVKFTEPKSDPKKKQNRTQLLAKPRPNQILLELGNKFELVERLRQICTAFDGRQKTTPNIPTETIDKFDRRLRMAVAFIRQYKNCEQQRTDISKEISFLHMMNEVIVKASSQPFNDTGKQLLSDAFEVANRYGTATEIIQKEFQGIVREASKHSTGLGISLEEKKMVLAAMGFGRGHWYKCPNGHVYAIGECGGAMQQSTCPECGAGIGGGSHRLLSGNSVATEMDGATAAAWPQ